jgi:DNA-binding NarL/FixJ family response regulator
LVVVGSSPTRLTYFSGVLPNKLHALIAAHEGRFIEAKNELAVPLESDGQKHKGFFASFGGYLAEFMIVSESGDHQKGLALLQAALDQAIGAKNFPMVATLLGRMSYQQVLLGNTEEALLCINQSREMITDNYLSEELHQAVDIWEARVRYWVMDYKRADDLLSRSPDSYLMRAFRAGIYMSKGNNSKALEITETFDLQIPRQKLTYHLYRAHIFSDSSKGQFNEVRQAVEIGSKHGYFNHFLTQRSDVIQQYISLVAESPTPFNERLAKAAGERLNEMMVGSDDPTRSLTRREADILRHLGTGLPIGQIVTDLCVSKNTMKTHLKSIYRKLNATDRNDAVAKGKKLLKI